ncbi:hypothetical protein TD95_001863 [Thielaviopsis punctulata]|uniref:Protein kinase domain-containing protein n=1 Tax=Thielaviopsis punctulata TaxID=72032 RepID=A0A0F4ZCI4_9PEZI|nr:hypothetical protein TD95_001863 [Thielaviopsis punctulata]
MFNFPQPPDVRRIESPTSTIDTAESPSTLLPAFVPLSHVSRAETAPYASSGTPPAGPNSSAHKRTVSDFTMLSPDSRSPSGFHSPLRHHRRTPSMRTVVKVSSLTHFSCIISDHEANLVKETLNAHTESNNFCHRVNQYRLGSEVGHGSYGSVYRAVDAAGVEYAVKEFSKSRMRRRVQSQLLRARGPGRFPGGRPGPMRPPASPRVSVMGMDMPGAGDPLFLIREEVAVMKKLHHENLVQLIEVLDDPEGDSLYMVLEICKRGVVQKFDENKRATPLEEEKARHYFRDLILGIEYLHSQGIVHRDIKPDNLLLSEDDVMKISDFGVSEMFSNDRIDDMKVSKDAGSPAFMAPELCRARHGDVAGKAVDIWAMGITLYCFRYGKIPFDEGDNMLEMFHNICEQTPWYPEDESPEFLDLMSRILDKNPQTRIKMPELREHAWVTMCGIDPLLSEEENCAELIEPPNELELSRALTLRTTNIFTVVCISPKKACPLYTDSSKMKVLHKLKSRVAKRKALEKEAALKSPRAVSPIDVTNNDEIAAEITHRRERYKARNKKSLLDLPLDEDLNSGVLVGSGLPKPPAHIGYLGIGTGSQYHVPKHDSDADYVAASPTMVSFDFTSALASAAQMEHADSSSNNSTTSSPSADAQDEFRLCSSSRMGFTESPGVDDLVAPLAAVRVDSGFEDVPTEAQTGKS